MKMYIVTKGSYSDYHIVGLFSDRKEADMYCTARGDDYNPSRVEEYEVDSIAVRGDKAPWVVSKTFWEDGKTAEFAEIGSDDAEEKFEVFELIGGDFGEGEVYTSIHKGQKCRRFSGVVMAKGRSHALKILGEEAFVYNSTNPLKF